MTAIRPRAAWMTGLLASAVAASLLTSAPAHAIAGDETADGAYAFTAKLDIDGRRYCSAALVEQEWLISAASCFTDDLAKDRYVPEGAPRLKTTATIGRTDITGKGGSVVDVVELVPHKDRDLVMARLARPVTDVKPVRFSPDRLMAGETVRVTGYGRTKDEWVPDRLHDAEFKIDSLANGTMSLSPKSSGTAVCAGDTGGPAFKDVGGFYELVGIHSTSGQAGCFGSEESETRRTATEVRVDDIKGWVRAVTARTVLSRHNWKDAVHTASGNFTRDYRRGNGPRKDLFVVWADGSASVFQGADPADDSHPFSAEYSVAPKGSYWKNAEAVTGTRVTDATSSGTSSDGLTVRWNTGKLSTFTHLDEYGLFEEKTLVYRDSWKNARSIAAGRHSSNGLRDDLAVLWADGSWSTYTDTGVNGVSKETQMTGATEAMIDAQLASGPFTGKDTDDLIVRWKNGMTDLLPGFRANGDFEGDDVSLRTDGSAWKYAQILTAGSFGGGGGEDLLIRWADGNLSYYADVDASGTHKEIQLVG
ncbi:S1 family peptidase [Streptomyces telluris]|uniref:S1 family peptidase n=1 Tax=Streptomyces telluris TaxID=2720021 RepID=A0A9X2LLQ2_9ACTN|nr:S1 family peptidase [Streptomyces telluris]MCQ8773448.1 S1 family peptidase [Streptomyces telluris]NJP78243.1 S1 family peptidase [Streptomyces telluris]